MGAIEEKAKNQAQRHADEFWNCNEWPDILEKFAEVSNLFDYEINKLSDREERGSRIEEADMADFFYYQEYYELLTHWIARAELVSNGYERDKHKNWILKKKPSTPPPTASVPKKKRGFWG